MKKIKKLSIILGVLLLGVIVMSSNADAKKKKTKYIDLSKYVTFKVTYNKGFPSPDITNYKKNSKFKYKGKKVTKKQFLFRNIDIRENKIIKNVNKAYYKNGKKIDCDDVITDAGNYIWKVKIKTKDNKNYIIKKKFTIKEACYNGIGITEFYYSDHWIISKYFKTDYLLIKDSRRMNFNSDKSIKCDYTFDKAKIVDFNDYNNGMDNYFRKYRDYFKKNNINSNADLQNFILNKTKDLGQICIQKDILVKRTNFSLTEMDFKKLNSEMYNEINSRFEDGMFWRLVKPRITISVKSNETGEPLKYCDKAVVSYHFIGTHPYSNHKECTKMWPNIIDMADPFGIYAKYYS